ncbi:MAG TPA: hypothetical protein VKT51_11475 [Candidatus Eremiobacteraceae bacterium]|nr:hypothetical protein [Candidatus Eremiobacteraceae bacterium]
MARFGSYSTQELFRHTYDEETTESSSFALAFRATGVIEICYLIADSFNFRNTLGAECSLQTEGNLHTLLRRLVEFAPHATQDAFVTAFARSARLPRPAGSLMEFLWAVSRSNPPDLSLG